MLIFNCHKRDEFSLFGVKAHFIQVLVAESTVNNLQIDAGAECNQFLRGIV